MDTPLKQPETRAGTVAARLAVGTVLLLAGVAKLFAPAATAAVIASRNLPAPEVLGVAAGLVEAVGGALLLARWQPRWLALGLALFVAFAVGLFHLPVVFAGPRALEFALDVAVLAALYLVFRREP